MSNLFAIVFVRQLFYKDEFARKISLKNMFLNIFFDFYYLTSNRKRVIKQLYYSLLYSHFAFSEASVCEHEDTNNFIFPK